MSCPVSEGPCPFPARRSLHDETPTYDAECYTVRVNGSASVPEITGGDYDENGVDRTQIRAMLRLTPAERLQRLEEFVDSIVEIRELNESKPVR